jgi:hypothetical protein
MGAVVNVNEEGIRKKGCQRFGGKFRSNGEHSGVAGTAY